MSFRQRAVYFYNQYGYSNPLQSTTAETTISNSRVSQITRSVLERNERALSHFEQYMSTLQRPFWWENALPCHKTLVSAI